MILLQKKSAVKGDPKNNGNKIEAKEEVEQVRDGVED